MNQDQVMNYPRDNNRLYFHKIEVLSRTLPIFGKISTAKTQPSTEAIREMCSLQRTLPALVLVDNNKQGPR